ncbi:MULTISPECIES: glycosyltransferase family 1 protein [Clostridium]|uniref:Glycosyltransferase family 4 protein n=1 Tax=Clostridium faecium TaxID=2762223 RepID=A0ABR8YS97_9CLOT|nr:MULTISPECIES: glycosyltransferase family 1 protein [Clostridium]MBD8047121.1 glycosyltransferase family 4 protein [Clostridium faecium]MDU1349605.1 glycosyltransferase family 1 protein [Clostridium argentinense]
MKIGIDARAAKWYRGTGIGTYTYQLINSLNNIDLANEYLLFTVENYNSQINFKNNFSLSPIKKSNSPNFWDEVNIPNVLDNKNIDIYHVPQNGVGLPIKKKCPFIITLHDTIPIHMPETVGDRYLEIFSTKMKSIIENSDGIITVSEFSKEDIAKDFNYPKEKIFVTYLASEDIYKPIDKIISASMIKKQYSLPSDYILYVGGFSPRKNILGLIKAYSKLPNNIKERHKLVIAGNKGKSYPIYKKCAEDYNVDNNVIFPGFISMEYMPYLYNAASLFVYPSFYEGFGLPPIEAMACGIPVIAANATSIPEILEDAAILFNPNDIDELQDKLYELLMNENIRQNIIHKGFIKNNSLSWEKTALDTLKAYKSILSL